MKLEVFFDYACPYCLRGHEYLCELMPGYPNLEVEWRPCEAHPRPDRYGPHSDWCAKGMMYAKNQGADLMEYHSRMFHAALTQRRDIEDLAVASDLMEGFLDCNAFYKVLSNGDYQGELTENNRLAWNQYHFSALPSLRMNDKELCSVENVGLTKQMIADFLSKNYAE